MPCPTARLVAITLCLWLSATAFSVAAQTYPWKHGSGRTVISDTPPPPGSGASRIRTPDGEHSGDAVKALQAKQADQRKRSEEAKENADKEAKAEALKAENKENCTMARNQLTGLESGQRISGMTASGERYVLDDNDRQKEINRIRKYMAENCK